MVCVLLLDSFRPADSCKQDPQRRMQAGGAMPQTPPRGGHMHPHEHHSPSSSYQHAAYQNEDQQAVHVPLADLHSQLQALSMKHRSAQSEMRGMQHELKASQSAIVDLEDELDEVYLKLDETGSKLRRMRRTERSINQRPPLSTYLADFSLDREYELAMSTVFDPGMILLYLRQVPAFRIIPDAVLHDFIQRGKHIRIVPGDSLAARRCGRSLNVILSGCAKYRDDSTDEDAQLGPGDVYGEHNLLDVAPSEQRDPEDWIAISEVLVLSLSVRLFRRIVLSEGMGLNVWTEGSLADIYAPAASISRPPHRARIFHEPAFQSVLNLGLRFRTYLHIAKGIPVTRAEANRHKKLVQNARGGGDAATRQHTTLESRMYDPDLSRAGGRNTRQQGLSDQERVHAPLMVSLLSAYLPGLGGNEVIRRMVVGLARWYGVGVCRLYEVDSLTDRMILRVDAGSHVVSRGRRGFSADVGQSVPLRSAGVAGLPAAEGKLINIIDTASDVLYTAGMDDQVCGIPAVSLIAIPVWVTVPGRAARHASTPLQRRDSADGVDVSAMGPRGQSGDADAQRSTTGGRLSVPPPPLAQVTGQSGGASAAAAAKPTVAGRGRKPRASMFGGISGKRATTRMRRGTIMPQMGEDTDSEEETGGQGGTGGAGKGGRGKTGGGAPSFQGRERRKSKQLPLRDLPELEEGGGMSGGPDRGMGTGSRSGAKGIGSNQHKSSTIRPGVEQELQPVPGVVSGVVGVDNVRRVCAVLLLANKAGTANSTGTGVATGAESGAPFFDGDDETVLVGVARRIGIIITAMLRQRQLAGSLARGGMPSEGGPGQQSAPIRGPSNEQMASDPSSSFVHDSSLPLVSKLHGIASASSAQGGGTGIRDQAGGGGGVSITNTPGTQEGLPLSVPLHLIKQPLRFRAVQIALSSGKVQPGWVHVRGILFCGGRVLQDVRTNAPPRTPSTELRCPGMPIRSAYSIGAEKHTSHGFVSDPTLIGQWTGTSIPTALSDASDSTSAAGGQPIPFPPPRPPPTSSTSTTTDGDAGLLEGLAQSVSGGQSPLARALGGWVDTDIPLCNLPRGARFALVVVSDDGSKPVGWTSVPLFTSDGSLRTGLCTADIQAGTWAPPDTADAWQSGGGIGVIQAEIAPPLIPDPSLPRAVAYARAVDCDLGRDRRWWGGLLRVLGDESLPMGSDADALFGLKTSYLNTMTLRASGMPPAEQMLPPDPSFNPRTTDGRTAARQLAQLCADAYYPQALKPGLRRTLWRDKFQIVADPQLVHEFGLLLPVLLRCMDWSNPSHVLEARLLLADYPIHTLTPTATLQLLGPYFPQPLVRATAVDRLADVHTLGMLPMVGELVAAAVAEDAPGGGVGGVLSRWLLMRCVAEPATVGRHVIWILKLLLSVPGSHKRAMQLLRLILDCNDESTAVQLSLQTFVLSQIGIQLMRLLAIPHADRQAALQPLLAACAMPCTNRLPFAALEPIMVNPDTAPRDMLAQAGPQDVADFAAGQVAASETEAAEQRVQTVRRMLACTAGMLSGYTALGLSCSRLHMLEQLYDRLMHLEADLDAVDANTRAMLASGRLTDAQQFELQARRSRYRQMMAEQAQRDTQALTRSFAALCTQNGLPVGSLDVTQCRLVYCSNRKPIVRALLCFDPTDANVEVEAGVAPLNPTVDAHEYNAAAKPVGDSAASTMVAVGGAGVSGAGEMDMSLTAALARATGMTAEELEGGSSPRQRTASDHQATEVEERVLDPITHGSGTSVAMLFSVGNDLAILHERVIGRCLDVMGRVWRASDMTIGYRSIAHASTAFPVAIQQSEIVGAAHAEWMARQAGSAMHAAPLSGGHGDGLPVTNAGMMLTHPGARSLAEIIGTNQDDLGVGAGAGVEGQPGANSPVVNLQSLQRWLLKSRLEGFEASQRRQAARRTPLPRDSFNSQTGGSSARSSAGSSEGLSGLFAEDDDQEAGSSVGQQYSDTFEQLLHSLATALVTSYLFALGTRQPGEILITPTGAIQMASLTYAGLAGQPDPGLHIDLADPAANAGTRPTVDPDVPPPPPGAPPASDAAHHAAGTVPPPPPPPPGGPGIPRFASPVATVCLLGVLGQPWNPRHRRASLQLQSVASVTQTQPGGGEHLLRVLESELSPAVRRLLTIATDAVMALRAIPAELTTTVHAFSALAIPGLSTPHDMACLRSRLLLHEPDPHAAAARLRLTFASMLRLPIA